MHYSSKNSTGGGWWPGLRAAPAPAMCVCGVVCFGFVHHHVHPTHVGTPAHVRIKSARCFSPNPPVLTYRYIRPYMNTLEFVGTALFGVGDFDSYPLLQCPTSE